MNRCALWLTVIAGLALPVAAAEQLEPLALLAPCHVYGAVARYDRWLYAVEYDRRMAVFEIDGHDIGFRRSLLLPGDFHWGGSFVATPEGRLLEWGPTYPEVRLHHLADPLDPGPAGAFAASEVRALLARTPYVYLLAGYQESELVVVDWSDPARPGELSRRPLNCRGVGLAWSGDYLVVSDENGLRVMDVADPGRPAPMGFYSLPVDCSEPRLAAGGGLAAVRRYGTPTTLEIVDLADPWTPLAVGTLCVDGWFDLHDRLLVSSEVIFDLSHPGTPKVLANVDLPAASAGQFDGELLAVAAVGLAVVDLSVPSSPNIVYRQATEAAPFAALPWEGRLGLVFNRGLDIYDLANVALPALCGSLAIDLDGGPAGYDRGLVITRVNSNTLGFIDVSDPAAPALVRSLDVDHLWTFAVADSHAYLCVYPGDIGNEICVLDIMDPAAPVETCRVDVPSRYNQLALVPGALFVGSSMSETNKPILVFDRSDPGSLSQSSTIVTSGRCWKYMAADEHRLYVHDRGAEVDIYDLTVPTDPEFEATIITGGAGELAAAGGLLARGAPLWLASSAALPAIEPVGVSARSLGALALSPDGTVYGRDNSGVQSYRVATVPLGFVGGFANGPGSTAVARAWTANPGIVGVELTYDGIGTGVMLQPAGSGLFELALDLGGVPAGRHLLGLRGIGSSYWRPTGRG